MQFVEVIKCIYSRNQVHNTLNKTNLNYSVVVSSHTNVDFQILMFVSKVSI